jgi:hypothetical protein
MGLDMNPEWRPTPELRFLTPPHTTTQPPKLQQLWVADTLNGWGHVSGYIEEWRDVPLVVGQ